MAWKHTRTALDKYLASLNRNAQLTNQSSVAGSSIEDRNPGFARRD